MYTTLTRFFDACQPFGYPLLACSVLLLAALFYHGIFVRPLRLHRLMAAAAGNTVRPLALNHPHEPLSQAVLLLLREKDNPALESMLEAKLRTIVNDQRDGLSLIAIITNISPMLGILGTAWGLVDIFGVFGSPDAQDTISMGISKALYTTIFGLAIALPGIIAGICFERRLEQRATRINELFTDLLARRHSL